MVLEMKGRWPFSCYFGGFRFQDLFSIARSILVQLLLSFFSVRCVSVHVLHLYSIIDTTAAGKRIRFILSDRPESHMYDNLCITDIAFAGRVLMPFSVDETVLPR